MMSAVGNVDKLFNFVYAIAPIVMMISSMYL